MASKEVQKQLDTLPSKIDNVPKKMKLFSLSMRILYTHNAVGRSSDIAIRFRKLRDDTRNDAVVYVKGVLPVVKQCVSGIKDYFEYYIDLSMDEWWESILDIIVETKHHEETCRALIAMHEDIITNLKKRQDDAKILIDEVEYLSGEYEREAEELMEIAHILGALAIGLAAVPYVNIIATPMFGAAAQYERVEAVRKQKESKFQIATTEVVKQNMVPALSNFVSGLQDIAGFFSALHQELKAIHSKGEKARDVEEPKRIHYITMKGKANRIMSGCNGFFAVLPSIRTDLEAIPVEGTDQNYVDRWMEKQKEIIMKKCSSNDLVKSLMKAIASGSN